MNAEPQHPLAFEYRARRFGRSVLIHADAFEWMSRLPPESLDGMVLDPPYGVEEYEVNQLQQMLSGGPGIWRIPPSFDGCKRAPLPRFTALDGKQRATLRTYFKDFATLALPALKQKARQLGNIKELTEDEETGSLTIKIEV